MEANYWISKLGLQPHPEGGYYKETYRCIGTIDFGNEESKRNINTAIYFLLAGKDKSHFHRIKSDELWFFHEGSALEIYVLGEKGLQTICLGKNAEAGEVFQAVIPAGLWFASRLKEGTGFALVSCTVAPGFDFRDFELATKSQLLREFPDEAALIGEMTLS